MVSRRARSQPARLGRPPNLIVFLPDQHRADTIACYGAPRAYTPNLDKLAAQACVFEHAYVAQPVCTPSRSCLLTGTWPHMNGCTRNGIHLPPTLPCLPELVANSDYRFAYMGKWHLGDEVLPQHGFNDWVSSMSGSTTDIGKSERNYAARLSDYEKFLEAQGLQPDDTKRGVFSKNKGSTLPIELSKPRFLQTKACEFIDRHRDDPFVLFVAFFEPHPPYYGPLNDLYPQNEITLDPTARHEFDTDMPVRYRLRQEWMKKRYGFASEKLYRTKQRYLGLVTEVDCSIGAILQKLEQAGLTDDTILMHTSDHGDMMGAHGLVGKEVMFEEAVRVPWIVRLPGQQRQISISQSVSHIDFMPTVVDLLGKPAMPDSPGKSLAPLLRGESLPPESVFMEWHPGRHNRAMKKTRIARKEDAARALNESTRAVVTPDGWKLCLRNGDLNELYNLKADPGESRNLFNDSVGQDILRRLTGEIHRWQERVNDHLPV